MCKSFEHQQYLHPVLAHSKVVTPRLVSQGLGERCRGLCRSAGSIALLHGATGGAATSTDPVHDEEVKKPDTVVVDDSDGSAPEPTAGGADIGGAAPAGPEVPVASDEKVVKVEEAVEEGAIRDSHRRVNHTLLRGPT